MTLDLATFQEIDEELQDLKKSGQDQKGKDLISKKDALVWVQEKRRGIKRWIVPKPEQI